MLAGKAADDGEAETGAGEARQVGRLARHGAFGAAELDVTHDEPGVLDADDRAGRDLLDVHMDVGGRRREVGRVVEEFGERVHDALGGVTGDGGLAGGVQPDPAVGADTAHRAAQDRLHGNRPRPAAARARAREDGDGVGEAARLGGAVVEVEEVGEDVLVGVTFLHGAEVGEGAGGEGLHPAGHVGGDCEEGGAIDIGLPGAFHEQDALLGDLPVVRFRSSDSRSRSRSDSVVSRARSRAYSAAIRARSWTNSSVSRPRSCVKSSAIRARSWSSRPASRETAFRRWRSSLTDARACTATATATVSSSAAAPAPPARGSRTDCGATATAAPAAVAVSTAVTSGKGRTERRAGRSPGERGELVAVIGCCPRSVLNSVTQSVPGGGNSVGP